MKLKSLPAPRLLMSGLALWAACAASSAAGGGQKMKETPTPTPTPNQAAPRYSTDLDELRAAFNRDKGKVRLVTLLSPT